MTETVYPAEGNFVTITDLVHEDGTVHTWRAVLLNDEGVTPSAPAPEVPTQAPSTDVTPDVNAPVSDGSDTATSKEEPAAPESSAPPATPPTGTEEEPPGTADVPPVDWTGRDPVAEAAQPL